MSTIKTTYKEVKSKYPELVKQVMVKIHKGKSKKKDDKPEIFNWSYDYYKKAECISLANFKEHIKTKQKILNLEERMNKLVEDSEITICADDMWFSNDKIKKSKFPKILLDLWKKQYTTEIIEENRVANLSSEERAKEIGNCLTELGRSQGKGDSLIIGLS